MRMTYSAQLAISVGMVLLANVLCTLCGHWACRSAGFVLCGLLWLVHPVLPKGAANTKGTLLGIRGAGLVLILIGVFSRAFY